MTSGQETERVNSYNPGARTGHLGGDAATWLLNAQTAHGMVVAATSRVQ